MARTWKSECMEVETISVEWCGCFDCISCTEIDEAIQHAYELGTYWGFDGFSLDGHLQAKCPDVRQLLQDAYDEGIEDKRREYIEMKAQGIV